MQIFNDQVTIQMQLHNAAVTMQQHSVSMFTLLQNNLN